MKTISDALQLLINFMDGSERAEGLSRSVRAAWPRRARGAARSTNVTSFPAISDRPSHREGVDNGRYYFMFRREEGGADTIGLIPGRSGAARGSS